MQLDGHVELRRGALDATQQGRYLRLVLGDEGPLEFTVFDIPIRGQLVGLPRVDSINMEQD